VRDLDVFVFLGKVRLFVHVLEGKHDRFNPYFPNNVRVHYCLRWRRDGTCALKLLGGQDGAHCLFFDWKSIAPFAIILTQCPYAIEGGSILVAAKLTAIDDHISGSHQVAFVGSVGFHFVFLFRFCIFARGSPLA
jgi:hypothetical protein